MPSSHGFSVMMNKNFNAMNAAYEKHIQTFLEKTATKYELSLEELKESWKEYDITSTISFSLKKKKGSGNESNGGDGFTTVKKPKQMPFIVFSNRHRAVMKEQNPNAKHIDIAKLLGQKWKALSKEEQSQYYIQIPTVATAPLTTESTINNSTEPTVMTHLPPPRQLFASSSDSQEEDEDDDRTSSSEMVSFSSRLENDAAVGAPPPAATANRPNKTSLTTKIQKKKTESISCGGGGGGDDGNMFDSKKIKELRQMCSEQGLSMDGKKEVLIQRLMDKLNTTRVPTSPSSYHDEEEPRLNTTQLDQSDDEENEFEYNASDSD
uniref:HMG box domain-containing protein n=1 Tax=viral metagenome TaxID=1070528 RepID=A0A6C0D243_9ZZZZ